ncbi:hypothetical protein EWP20_02430 [Neisseria meningitidis]|uniref:Uncharacterized protein n=2 Tax=Neisseria meningitidis TaxID=487 RepID=E6MX80_NEIMH|nr:hypothetical protein A6J49_13895 [Neisseria meningitidis]EFV63904.1 hypothetical protein NMH_0685 [Neisseria meningitidis H44/76]MBG8578018.1 hypothetical protein [Neisseria meningitidis]MBG8594807.1 hypothetical protein [Neisseria meningitidis]MBG8604062.1 hypothetical protein [Neisseria meningitidis]
MVCFLIVMFSVLYARNSKSRHFHKNRKSRHSRAGGNPVRSVSVISNKSLSLCVAGFLLS